MDRFVLTADDRTGALETAGALAVRLGAAVRVSPLGVAGSAERQVIDLGTRRLAPVAAAAAVGRLSAAPTAHKIDSTLRGNWAAEVAAFVADHRVRVLVVPALPENGRVCRGGQVFVDGVPVSDSPAGTDARHPVRSSRPIDHLVAAGIEHVESIVDHRSLLGWFAADSDAPHVAVCDAVTTDDLERIGAAWRHAVPRPLFVGTAGAIAAALAGASTPSTEPPTTPRATAVLVVCGSLHPAARRQVATLVYSPDPLDRVAVLVSPRMAHGGAPVPTDDAGAVADALARRAAAAVDTRSDRALVVRGGDTAAAVLGIRAVDVRGVVAPGTPWATFVDDGRLVVTRSGGFGSHTALVDLVASVGAGRL